MLAPLPMPAVPASTSATASPPPSRSASSARCLASLAKAMARRRPLSVPLFARTTRSASRTGPQAIAPLGEAMPAPASSQPASSVSATGSATALRPGLTEHGEAIGELGTGAAQGVRHPGERQARLLERRPGRRLPGLVGRPVDGAGIAHVLENARRGLGDDAVPGHCAPVLPHPFSASGLLIPASLALQPRRSSGWPECRRSWSWRRGSRSPPAAAAPWPRCRRS